MCESEFHCWKLGDSTENRTGDILNLMNEISKVFFTKNQRRKNSFPFWKTEFWNTGNSVHTTEYLALGKALLANLKVKVYITKLISVYIIY